MKYIRWTWIAVITLSSVVPRPAHLTAQQNSAQPQSYTVIDLGTLGGTFSFGGGVNEQGWVNGESSLPGDQTQHAFLWRNGVIVDLGTLGGPNSASGYTLNEAGLVAGGSETSL
jgi:probable HAF family extracellular repeat protein